MQLIQATQEAKQVVQTELTTRLASCYYPRLQQVDWKRLAVDYHFTAYYFLYTTCNVHLYFAVCCFVFVCV